MTDHLADALNTMKTHEMVGQDTCTVASTKLIEEVLKLLKEQFLIHVPVAQPIGNQTADLPAAAAVLPGNSQNSHRIYTSSDCPDPGPCDEDPATASSLRNTYLIHSLPITMTPAANTTSML